MQTSMQKQQGVMMIEALVGILIFSFGILAMMGLQAISIKNTVEARYRTEASFIANEIIGTMWTECGGAACTLTAYDTTSGTSTKMTAWRTEVANRLPGVVIGGTNSPTITIAGNVVTVTVFWKIPGTDAATHNFRTIAQINAS
jgi:type IV pilus assembly protein PilV